MDADADQPADVARQASDDALAAALAALDDAERAASQPYAYRKLLEAQCYATLAHTYAVREQTERLDPSYEYTGYTHEVELTAVPHYDDGDTDTAS